MALKPLAYYIPTYLQSSTFFYLIYTIFKVKTYPNKLYKIQLSQLM